MTWQNTLQIGQELSFCSINSDGSPHAIIVISKGIEEGKLILNNCEMLITEENIKLDNRVCIISKKDDEYYRIEGQATMYTSGKFYDISVSRNKSGAVKSSIVIEINWVFDLDKGEKII